MICSICGKLSGSGKDHLNCVEMRRVEAQDQTPDQDVSGRLDAKDDALAGGIRAVMQHMKWQQ